MVINQEILKCFKPRNHDKKCLNKMVLNQENCTNKFVQDKEGST